MQTLVNKTSVISYYDTGIEFTRKEVNKMDKTLDVKDTEEAKLPEEPSTSEETTEEVEEPQAEVATEAEGTETETAESKKGYSNRVRELNTKAKDAEAKAEAAEAKAQSLSEKLAEITEPIGLQGQESPTYNPQVQDGEQITPERYQGDVANAANQVVDWRLKQERAVNQIDKDANAMLRKYPELDPDGDSFNKELSDAVTAAVEKEAVTVSYDRTGKPIRTVNLNANVKGMVNTLMKPYKAAVTKEVGQATENIAKQVSETALRPTSVRKQEKAPGDKTLEELEQDLGIVNS